MASKTIRLSSTTIDTPTTSTTGMVIYVSNRIFNVNEINGSR